jgi:thiol-disulfide isomerase/thioredoxin
MEETPPPKHQISDVAGIISAFKSPGLIIVLAHATWCGHCKSMYPYWNDISSSVRMMAIESEVIKKLDAGHSADLPAKWDVGGFPAVMAIKNNAVISVHTRGGPALNDWIGTMSPVNRSPVNRSTDTPHPSHGIRNVRRTNRRRRTGKRTGRRTGKRTGKRTGRRTGRRTGKRTGRRTGKRTGKRTGRRRRSKAKPGKLN